MSKKEPISGLKAFMLLLVFMFLCVTIGAVFFSKFVLLLSTYGWIRNTFLFLVFSSILAFVGFYLYKAGAKTFTVFQKALPYIHKISSKMAPYLVKIKPYTRKLISSIQKVKVTHFRQKQNMGFISTWNGWKKNKENK